MVPIALCPIALGRVIGDPVIEAIAKAHERSAAQIAIRWIVQQPDMVAIPKTAKLERLSENLRRLRLRTDRCRDGADRRADPARFTSGERAAMGPSMGRRQQQRGGRLGPTQ